MNDIKPTEYSHGAGCGHTIEEMTDEQKYILCDAQTSGGLLAIVKQENVFERLIKVR